MRTPGAVPNLCKADSGLSAMIGILVAISLKIAPMRTNKFSNAGFDLQGEYEEQQLQLGFLAYLPQIMVGRRIAPDGSLMDPHPHSIRQHLEE